MGGYYTDKEIAWEAERGPRGATLPRWIRELPEREYNHVLKTFEYDANIKMCADTWIEMNPDMELNLKTCFRTHYRLNLCPYSEGNEPCRV